MGQDSGLFVGNLRSHPMPQWQAMHHRRDDSPLIDTMGEDLQTQGFDPSVNLHLISILSPESD